MEHSKFYNALLSIGTEREGMKNIFKRWHIRVNIPVLLKRFNIASIKHYLEINDRLVFLYNYHTEILYFRKERVDDEQMLYIQTNSDKERSAYMLF